MILEQFYLNCLAHASYLVGDRESRTAVIVDPQRDVQRYLDAAERHGLQIRYVFLTHFHADFVAGHLELRDRTGAAICLGARARAEYAFTPMHDGEAIEHRARASAGPRDAGPHGRVDLDPRVRPRHRPGRIPTPC